MTAPVSVILVRENAEQLTGSGCCGKLEGDNAAVGAACDVFTETRRHQVQAGLLHRTIRELFPPRDGHDQVDVVIVDPRNQLYLIAKLVRDVWRYRPGWRSGLATMLQMFSLPAVIVNGRVISRRGTPTDPDRVCHAIGRHLRSPAGTGDDDLPTQHRLST